MFFDDELNVNRQFMELLDAIVALQDELGEEFRLRGFLKAELITQPMAQAMYRAGFRQVLVGFESGHPRVLQNIQKKATKHFEMKMNLAGEFCGVCHMTVAFPMSDCRACHPAMKGWQ